MISLRIKLAVTIITILLFPFLAISDISGSAINKPAKKIIDMHAHIAGIGAGDSGCFISDDMKKSWKFRIYMKSLGVSEKEVKEKGDSIIIKRFSEELSQSEYVKAAVVLALDGVIGESGDLDIERTEVYIPNEYVLREISKYDNLLFGASINPYRSDAIKRLDKIAEDGAVLLKWLPAIQLIDPADESLVPFYLRLKELGLPLLIHVGDEHSFTKAKNEYADPQRLHLPLKLGVTVIAAHAGTSGKNNGTDNMERLLPMFDEYPNLYADISSLTQINKIRYLGRLLKHTDIYDRLLYGTDMPLINTGLTSPLFHIFKLSPFELISLFKIDNPWDRDVQLKKALDVPEEIFMNTERVLNLGYEKAGE